MGHNLCFGEYTHASISEHYKHKPVVFDLFPSYSYPPHRRSEVVFIFINISSELMRKKKNKNKLYKHNILYYILIRGYVYKSRARKLQIRHRNITVKNYYYVIYNVNI